MPRMRWTDLWIATLLITANSGAVAAQDVPADYQGVLTTLGEEGRLQGRRPESQHSAERPPCHDRAAADADTVRVRRVDRADEG